MKTLYIMRHNKKESKENAVDDFDRKLSDDGILDAKKMGQRLNDMNIHPDLIVSSPAQRTKMTSEIVANEINYTKSIMYNEVLYEAYVNEIIETITYTFDTVDSMILVAHNPSLTALTITLDVYREEIHPGEIIKVEFDVNSWIDIAKENAKFCWIEKPE